MIFSAFVFEAPKINTHILWKACGGILNLLWYSLETFSSVEILGHVEHTHYYIIEIDSKLSVFITYFFQHFYQIPDLKKETQTKLDDYFSDPFGDEDNEDLLKVMDEIDGVQEKKIKLDS